MKAVYLKNFRKGFATNSSSTHSIIYRNKDEMFKDLNIFELNYYDRFDNTIAASREAKIKYVAANIFWNETLFEVMCQYYPEMKQYSELAKKARKNGLYEEFGMYTRGSLSFRKGTELEASIDFLKNVIDDEDIIIVGGSDETDFVYDTTEGHKEIALPDDIGIGNVQKGIVKNGNYWIGYGWDGKIRFKTEKGDCVPSYPELVDLRITNKCQHGCPFCFMDSSMKEKEADFLKLKNIINQLSSNEYDRYDRRIEFSVGGGNILLYPHLEELFKYMKERGHIINTTINAKDCKEILSNEKYLKLFKDYVTAIGVSVTDENDIDILGDFKFSFNRDDYKQITIHLIPELLGVEKTREFIQKIEEQYKYFNFLFLGYKTNGRGKTQEYKTFNDDELTKLFGEDLWVSIDTTFANTYKDWLEKNFETEKTITLNEGEYSMYIDAVEGIAYKSSYQLDKPYDIKYGGYEEHGKTWFTPIEAFANIRRDNGFKVYDEEDTESA